MVQQKLVFSEKTNNIGRSNHDEPELRFPEFNGKWKTVQINDLLEMCYGKDFKHLNKGKYPVLGTGGVIDYVDGFLYSGESILIGRKGTIDKPRYINESFWTVDTLFYTKIYKGMPKFIFYQLNNINWLKYNEASGVPSLSANNVKKIRINLPSEKEQMKIANFLTKIDEKIELLEKKIYLIRNLKEFILQNKIKEINRKRDFVKVEEIFSLTRGEVIAKTKIKSYPDESYKYPVYSSQTVNDGVMGYYKDYDFDGEYITWTTDGANAGKTKFRKGKFKCSNVCGVLKAKKGYEFYTNEFMANYLDKNTHKYVSYVGNPKLMNNVMAKIKLPLVEKNTQQTFSKIISAFDLKIELSMQELNQMENFKKGLLQKMFV